AQQAFDVGTGHVLTSRRRAHPGQRGAGIRTVRGALAVEVGQQRHPVGTGNGSQGQLGELLVGDASSARAASRMREALMVVAIGRKRPVASAKPVTAPLASPGREALTIAHTPEVPIETDTSPGPSDRPSAAPMLSP